MFRTEQPLKGLHALGRLSLHLLITETFQAQGFCLLPRREQHQRGKQSSCPSGANALGVAGSRQDSCISSPLRGSKLQNCPLSIASHS